MHAVEAGPLDAVDEDVRPLADMADEPPLPDAPDAAELLDAAPPDDDERATGVHRKSDASSVSHVKPGSHVAVPSMTLQWLADVHAWLAPSPELLELPLPEDPEQPVASHIPDATTNARTRAERMTGP